MRVSTELWSAPLLMLVLAPAPLLELMTDLKRQWLRALDASAAAIDTAVRAHLLAAGDSRRGRLAAERAWLELVDWTALELVEGGTIATLESPAPMTQPALVRAAWARDPIDARSPRARAPAGARPELSGAFAPRRRSPTGCGPRATNGRDVEAARRASAALPWLNTGGDSTAAVDGREPSSRQRRARLALAAGFALGLDRSGRGETADVD